ncbi:F-box protein [Trifolium pratense]|uniref:F-box protein n=1 Tax=Trifolium pratense TaxID=57577 RepID=A0A2K3NAA6_TRIPR|nr:F-box protein [Trifolium pratense]
MATNFIRTSSAEHTTTPTPPESIYLCKAVSVTCHGKQPLVLGIDDNCDRLMLKCGNENWKEIRYMSMRIGDICILPFQTPALCR